MDFYSMLFQRYLNRGKATPALNISYPVYKGGTEQILPENEAVPTTSPIRADIRYPDGTRKDQEFTYRQVPSAVDGNAKIKNIYGNSIVWNQQLPELNSTYWQIRSDTGSGTITNGEATITASANYPSLRMQTASRISYKANHRYLIMCDVKTSRALQFRFFNSLYTAVYTTSTSYTRFTATITPTSDLNAPNTGFESNNAQSGDILYIKNPQIIDMTQMGLDALTVAQFQALFDYPYYTYNAGTLLSFNGTDIKTIGFNQWDEDWEQGAINNSGNNTDSTTQIRSKGYIPILPNTSYCFYAGHERVSRVYWYDENQTFISYNTNASSPEAKTPPQNARYMRIQTPTAYGGTYLNDICISIYNGTLNNQYVPYTEHTTSLPVSDYFPAGMKSAGTVYDELSDSKVVTRVGSVDLGTLTWSIPSGFGQYNIFNADLPTMKAYTTSWRDNVNFISSLYFTSIETGANLPNLGVRQAATGNAAIWVRNTDYSDVNTFKSAMSGVYLFYELNEYDEEDLLVTQNRALSTVLGKDVFVSNPGEALDILMKGE